MKIIKENCILKLINVQKKEDFENGNFQVQLCSVHPDGRYSTNVFSVASTWFFKRELIEKLGPWKLEHELYITPSQEWIFRASRLGISFHFPHRVGVLVDRKSVV